jgi:hypothetical protein
MGLSKEDFLKKLEEIYVQGGSPDVMIVKDPRTGQYVTINFISGLPIILHDEPLKNGHFYWVRLSPDGEWEPARWYNDGFELCGSDLRISDWNGLNTTDIGDEIIAPEGEDS